MNSLPLLRTSVLRRDGKERKGGAGNQWLFNRNYMQPGRVDYTPENIPASVSAGSNLRSYICDLTEVMLMWTRRMLIVTFLQ